MLTDLATLQLVPTLTNVNSDWLTILLSAADRTIKNFTKQLLEQTTVTEYYSGGGYFDLPLDQMRVSSITNVWLDPTGAWGQRSGGFPSTSVLTAGVHYALILDKGGVVSNRGVVRRLGGFLGGQSFGFWPQYNFPSKLAAVQRPVWPYGDGNIKVTYVSGWAAADIPSDLVAAMQTLVAYFVRTIPSGGAFASESYENYAYSVMSKGMGEDPELGSLRQILINYRDFNV